MCVLSGMAPAYVLSLTHRIELRHTENLDVLSWKWLQFVPRQLFYFEQSCM